MDEVEQGQVALYAAAAAVDTVIVGELVVFVSVPLEAVVVAVVRGCCVNVSEMTNNGIIP